MFFVPFQTVKKQSFAHFFKAKLQSIATFAISLLQQFT